MTKFSVYLIAIFLSITLFGSVARSQTVPFDSDHWEIKDKNATVEDYLGRKSLHLKSGIALLKNVTLEDGVSEVDMAAPDLVSCIGIVFRFWSEDGCELVCFRPRKCRQ